MDMPNMTVKRRPGRPRQNPEGGPYKYVSVALLPEDISLVNEWAWRLRKPKAYLMRELIEKGLQPFRDSLDKAKEFPLPPAAPEPVTPRLKK